MVNSTWSISGTVSPSWSTQFFFYPGKCLSGGCVPTPTKKHGHSKGDERTRRKMKVYHNQTHRQGRSVRRLSTWFRQDRSYPRDATVETTKLVVDKTLGLGMVGAKTKSHKYVFVIGGVALGISPTLQTRRIEMRRATFHFAKDPQTTVSQKSSMTFAARHNRIIHVRTGLP